LTGTARISGQNPTPKYMSADREIDRERETGYRGNRQKREKKWGPKETKIKYRKGTGRKRKRQEK